MDKKIIQHEIEDLEFAINYLIEQKEKDLEVLCNHPIVCEIVYRSNCMLIEDLRKIIKVKENEIKESN